MAGPDRPEPGNEPDGRPAVGGSNALAGQPSAYLRQHADNPVDWQPFGDAAFDAARDRDVPVFLSIGYAACHWCHVMAHESFEDEDTAQYLNAHFVPVKVDREERPDVDATYMAATQAISGEGGWPMSVFVTPDGLAFHAGTYFPPRPAVGRPSFRQVLEAVHEAWAERRDQVERSAAGLARTMAENPLARGLPVAEPAGDVPVAEPAVDLQVAEPAAGPPADATGPAVVVPAAAEAIPREVTAAAVGALSAAEDSEFGGFGRAPKFPPSPVLEFLIRHAATDAKTAVQARAMAARTLSAMATSALFDQLDGGFARYSVTADWSVPHFEKMLYDNASLLRVYAHWLRLPEGPDYARAEAERVVRHTAEWLLTALGLADGSFASSLDADTVVDGVHAEGATYLWNPEELAGAAAAAGWPELGPRLDRLMNVRRPGSVTADGSPLHPAGPLGPGERQLWETVAPELSRLRALRPQPARDDKVVAGWNGLAIAALADAGLILADTALLAAAAKAADYLARVHWNDGVLARISHDGQAVGIGGMLEDYAFAADGLLALYGATGTERWYLLAEELIVAAERRFIVEGVLVDAAAESAQVVNAQGGKLGAEPFDGPTPSASAALAGVLVSYAAYSGSGRHRALAARILASVSDVAARAPRAAGWALATAEALLSGPLEVAVVGPAAPDGPAAAPEMPGTPDLSSTGALLRAAALAASPGLVLASWQGRPAGQLSAVPLLTGRTDAERPLAYVCRAMVCRRPVSTVPELLTELAARPEE
ncbi:MAG TPA: thioredoxin domain-containing protein [Micrococcaceae bacterium]|jgi:hypothetical protein|nr:thioredoxin domain-containing protein [Micrococcaceae bacterium]